MKLLRDRLLSRVAVFAFFAAFGSSVHGCSTTSGLHWAISPPEPPPLPVVEKPLM
jgi:hypothetical protein